jgi:hypothetical protein
MPETRRSRPAVNRTASTSIHASGHRNPTSIPGYQRHEPLTAEDWADAAVLAAAAELGYRLATRCLRCNQWLVAHSSVARHLGPVCAGKAVNQ